MCYACTRVRGIMSEAKSRKDQWIFEKLSQERTN